MSVQDKEIEGSNILKNLEVVKSEDTYFFNSIIAGTKGHSP
jgi:hypothetical protein